MWKFYLSTVTKYLYFVTLQHCKRINTCSQHFYKQTDCHDLISVTSFTSAHQALLLTCLPATPCSLVQLSPPVALSCLWSPINPVYKLTSQFTQCRLFYVASTSLSSDWFPGTDPACPQPVCSVSASDLLCLLSPDNRFCLLPAWLLPACSCGGTALHWTCHLPCVGLLSWFFSSLCISRYAAHPTNYCVCACASHTSLLPRPLTADTLRPPQTTRDLQWTQLPIAGFSLNYRWTVLNKRHCQLSACLRVLHLGPHLTCYSTIWPDNDPAHNPEPMAHPGRDRSCSTVGNGRVGATHQPAPPSTPSLPSSTRYSGWQCPVKGRAHQWGRRSVIQLNPPTFAPCVKHSYCCARVLRPSAAWRLNTSRPGPNNCCGSSMPTTP